ncbi:hypothetical protein BKA70DRAFT_1247173, partial [Coprinopsis sp. MPI-PUGE-AT-0042]
MASRPSWLVYGAEAEKTSASESASASQALQDDTELGKAIQISADHILSLIEEEKQAVYNAERQKYRALHAKFEGYKVEQSTVLAAQTAHNQHLNTQVSQMAQELRRANDELNATRKEAQRVAELESEIASLKATQDELRSQLQAKTTEAEDRMNQLGIYSGDAPGLYRFGSHWHRLFYEMSVELSRPVTPPELNQAIESLIALLVHRRAVAPTAGAPQTNQHPHGSPLQIIYYPGPPPGVPPPTFAYQPPPPPPPPFHL